MFVFASSKIKLLVVSKNLFIYLFIFWTWKVLHLSPSNI